VPLVGSSPLATSALAAPPRPAAAEVAETDTFGAAVQTAPRLDPPADLLPGRVVAAPAAPGVRPAPVQRAAARLAAAAPLPLQPMPLATPASAPAPAIPSATPTTAGVQRSPAPPPPIPTPTTPPPPRTSTPEPKEPEIDLDALAPRIYRRIRDQLWAELRTERERLGRLTDLTR
jgi:hypothetical protein